MQADRPYSRNLRMLGKVYQNLFSMSCHINGIVIHYNFKPITTQHIQDAGLVRIIVLAPFKYAYLYVDKAS